MSTAQATANPEAKTGKPATNIGKPRIVNPSTAKPKAKDQGKPKATEQVGPPTKTQAEIDALKAELKAKQDALKLERRKASSSGKMERFVKYEQDTQAWLDKATKAFQEATKRHDYALQRLNEYKASLEAPKAVESNKASA